MGKIKVGTLLCSSVPKFRDQNTADYRPSWTRRNSDKYELHLVSRNDIVKKREGLEELQVDNYSV